ncbi:MAG: LytTR family DNA-binding domain-containing protein [Bacteroidetes bacterium]|nr:LytTR family DNA-binding domain-containing protein [Bacteroidota bacterium]
MKTKCLLVDDEPLAIKLIKGYIEELDDLSIVGEAKNGLDALKFIETDPIDLIFLDINMPRVSGLDLIKSLQYPPKVIIMSAHKEYAIDGFELNVVDFLLKPFSFDRFLKAINKYKNNINSVNNTVLNHEKTYHPILSLKDNKKVYNIKLDEILYIESMREYVKIHTLHESLLIKMALSKLDEGLPDNEFIRVHKSYIVPIGRVKVFSATFIELEDKKIPIGRNYKSIVLKRLHNQGQFI